MRFTLSFRVLAAAAVVCLWGPATRIAAGEKVEDVSPDTGKEVTKEKVRPAPPGADQKVPEEKAEDASPEVGKKEAPEKKVEDASPEVGKKEAPEKKVEDASPGAGKKVFVLPIEGAIDKGMLYVFRRAFREAKAAKPAAIIIDLNTPGGRLLETEEIINWMRSIKAPLYAFVNPNALSAGAIISLATDAIYMAPGGSIGSAMPIALSPVGGGVQPLPPDVQEKILSMVRAMVRGLAQENGHSEEIAEAMVDPAKEVKIGDRVICPEGKLLNLTAREAIEIVPPQRKPILAKAMVEDIDALLDNAGLKGAEVVRFEEQAVERLARYITLIGPLLLALGVLGIYTEIKTPGFGLPGIAGIVLLMIYFFGHYVAGLAGIEDIVLVIVGFVLLTIEIFVIPGFGVVGFAGLICIAVGFIMGMIPRLPSDLPPLPDVSPLDMAAYLQAALVRFLVAAGCVGVGGWALGAVLPKTSVYRSFVLQSTLSQEDGFVSSDQPKYEQLVGQEGVAATALRPAGMVMIGDARVDVVTSGDMIAKDAKVKVIDVEGSRVVVEEVKPSPDKPASA